MAPSSQIDWTQAFWCGFYAAGLIGTLALYGIFQERIMTQPYDGVKFGASAFLILSNRIFNCVYAGTMITVQGESFQNNAPLWKYLIVSLSNVAATMCQYECLKYVAFPVQMLGKSFKMMPVMLWGMVISGKRYTATDWLVAACVTGGVTEFLMTGPIAAPDDKGNSMHGLLLLVCFLACDGLTSTMQEKLFKEHATSKFNQMLYVNGCSALTSFVTVLAGGDLWSSLAFCAAHRDFVLGVMVLSSSAAGSQYFIYSQVKEFGALVFAATMNVRQVVSIILSYVNNHHFITPLQKLGLVVVFGALFHKSYKALTAEKKTDENSPLFPKTFEDTEKGAIANGPVDERLPTAR